MADSDGEVWLKIFLGKVCCVQKVVRFNPESKQVSQTWTCTEHNCNCEEKSCVYFTTTVSTERAAFGQSSSSDCIHGDTVIYKKKQNDGTLKIYEIAVIGMTLGERF